QILKMTQDPTDQIISTPSKTYQKFNLHIHSLPLQHLYSIIQHNPPFLPPPIILHHKPLQLPYNQHQIPPFLPPKVPTF
ncbi:ArsC/Spx/MgsR family protein, partial [Staphylococcus epidermidis]|uniref:ArsC/Spx/MgsR family protein n=1 Tax=Staphylococcus epidermidis TaxID=1282 RepID=UPI0028CBA086